MVAAVRYFEKSPLMISTFLSSYYDPILTLLDANADVDAKIKYGMTALHAAAGRGELPARREIIFPVNGPKGWTGEDGSHHWRTYRRIKENDACTVQYTAMFF